MLSSSSRSIAEAIGVKPFDYAHIEVGLNFFGFHAGDHPCGASFNELLHYDKFPSGFPKYAKGSHPSDFLDLPTVLRRGRPKKGLGHDPCRIQPLVWVVLTKLENSLARSHRSRCGRFLDESIALVEFSKHSRRACVETVAYAHIEVGLKI